MSDANTNTPNETGYSREYVKELRDEAAAYRVRAREAEEKYQNLQNTVSQQETTNSISSELAKRGIKADASWIKAGEGETPTAAVDRFLKDYPQFNAEPAPQQPIIKGQDPLKQKGPKSNTINTSVSELGAVKKDPVARAQLRDQYRAMLANSANTNFTIG